MIDQSVGVTIQIEILKFFSKLFRIFLKNFFKNFLEFKIFLNF